MSDVVIRFLSRKQVAERLGIKADTLSRYRLPEPDVMIGDVKGWTAETIDTWNESRPGRGWRGSSEAE